MKKVKLIQFFNGNEPDSIINVEDKVANDLINQNVAYEIEDNLVKSKMGKTKAFRKSPNIKKYEK